MHKATALLVTVALGGCAYTPTPAEFNAAHYGAPPAQPEQAIAAYFAGHLKDPESLKIHALTRPKKEFYLDPAHFNTDFGYGWHICAIINARNAHGGYVGNRNYHFFFNDNTVVYVTDAAMNSGRYLPCL